MNKKGFTLVELSIVLVIIGLLVGGILTGQSLIESAKVSSVIRLLQQTDIAASNFKTMYKGLPGDNNKLKLLDAVSIAQAASYGSQYLYGNMDGYVSYATAGMPPDHCSNTNKGCNHFYGEIANFYAQLGATGHYPGKFSADMPAGGFNSDPNNLNAPGKDFQILPVPCARGAYLSCYQLADFRVLKNPTDYLSSEKPYLKPTIAMAIDQKLDDGKPLTGLARNLYLDLYASQAPNECSDYNTNGHDEVNAKYNLQAEACYFNFAMLAFTPNQ